MQLFDDRIGRSGPLERLAIRVVGGDEVIDALHELLDAGERTAADRLVGDQREEALNLIEPRAVGRNEVYAGKRKKTRREVFLEEMEQVVPWKALLKIIEPHYPAAGRGRRPYPLEAILRVHLMQNWFALSDPAMEEALYEIASLRNFAGLKLSEPMPDETTILNFRHLLEESDLGEDIFKQVNAHL